MYVEYLPGEKHGNSKPERSDSPDAFTDAGYEIADNEVVIDIDHLPKESIKALIADFDIKTMKVWTERGVHLYFKKPADFARAKDGVCRLGFAIEQHTSRTRPNGMTIKKNGQLRQIDNENVRQYMPPCFKLGTMKHPYKDMTGMDEGDGRNKALFAHRKALGDQGPWEKYLRFINNHVFAKPMPEDEYNGIVRDVDMNSEPDDKYWIATKIMDECRTVLYSGCIWWFRDGEYLSDDGDGMLIRRIYQLCEGQPTRFVDEIVKQIKYRSKIIPGDEVFPIRFRNGIVTDGQFVPIKNFTDFTPYFIDIDYKPDAEPVQIVDDYIDALTSGDPDYRLLLMEVIGYVMITDPERIRSLGKFFMFRGDGANGKGTLLQIMKKIYNAKNCNNLSIKQLVDDRFKVTMIGKLANLGDDIEPETIDNDQLKILKNISTADTVSTRRLYSESESATFTVKLYFTTNSDIKSFEKGYAYKRRIVWLPMFNKVEKPDPNFISKATTKEALEYWIRLIVEGYCRLYHNQKWTEADIVKKYNDQYHDDNNVSLQFAKDLEEEEIIGKTANEIKEMFYEWSSDERKFSPKLFKEAVWDLYQIGIGRGKVGGKTKRVFMRQDDTNQKLMH